MALRDDNVLYWRLDTDGSVPDATGNGNTGTISNSTYDATGKINGCYTFDGINKRITSGTDVGNINGMVGDVTLTAWIKTANLTQNTFVISNGGGSTGQRGLDIQQDDETFYFKIRNDTKAWISSGSDLADTDWHFFAVTWDGTYMNAWIDDNQVETNLEYTGANSSSAVNALKVGARYNNTFHFQGLIDEVSVWDRALSSEEISEIYNSGTGLQYPYGDNELLVQNVMYLKMDTDGSIIDATGNGNDGTIVGATYTASGKINGAYTFDGVNDKITQATLLDVVPSAFSINFWVAFTDTFSSTSIISPYPVSKANIINQDFMALRFNATDGKLYFDSEQANAGFKTIGSTTSTWTAGTYYMITIIWDTTNGKRLFVNGSLENTDGAETTLMRDGTDSNFSIGVRGQDDNNWFPGNIDEVGYWDRVLTTDEITELYNSGTGLQYPYGVTPTGLNMQINIGDVWKSVDSVKINIGDTWKEVTAIKQNIGDVWKDV